MEAENGIKKTAPGSFVSPSIVFAYSSLRNRSSQMYNGIPPSTAPLVMGAVVGGVIVAPQVFVMGGAAPYFNVMDVFQKARGLYMYEELNLTELLTPCSGEKNFTVSTWDPALGTQTARDGKLAEVFRVKESSDCCARIVCGPARPFTMALVPKQPIVQTFNPVLLSRDTMFQHPDAMIIQRPFKCTFLCINRPVIYMSHNTAGRFATVTNPCAIFSHVFDIKAAMESDAPGLPPVNPLIAAHGGRKWYTVNGSLCQPAAFCLLPFGECARFRMQIYENDDYTKPIGEVARVFPGCFRSIGQIGDDFTIHFPEHEQDQLKRASLVSAVILLNYLFYERKQQNNNAGNYN